MRLKNLCYFGFVSAALAAGLPNMLEDYRTQGGLARAGQLFSTAAIVVYLLLLCALQLRWNRLYEQWRVPLESFYLIGLCMPFALSIFYAGDGVRDIFYQAVVHLCLVPFIDLPVSSTLIAAVALCPLYLHLDWRGLKDQGITLVWKDLLLRQAGCIMAWVGGMGLMHTLCSSMESGPDRDSTHIKGDQQSRRGLVSRVRHAAQRLEQWLLQIRRRMSAQDRTLVLATLFTLPPVTCFVKCIRPFFDKAGPPAGPFELYIAFLCMYLLGTLEVEHLRLSLLKKLQLSQELLCDLLPSHVVRSLLEANGIRSRPVSRQLSQAQIRLSMGGQKVFDRSSASELRLSGLFDTQQSRTSLSQVPLCSAPLPSPASPLAGLGRPAWQSLDEQPALDRQGSDRRSATRPVALSGRGSGGVVASEVPTSLEAEATGTPERLLATVGVDPDLLESYNSAVSKDSIWTPASTGSSFAKQGVYGTLDTVYSENNSYCGVGEEALKTVSDLPMSLRDMHHSPLTSSDIDSMLGITGPGLEPLPGPGDDLAGQAGLGLGGPAQRRPPDLLVRAPNRNSLNTVPEAVREAGAVAGQTRFRGSAWGEALSGGVEPSSTDSVGGGAGSGGAWMAWHRLGSAAARLSVDLRMAMSGAASLVQSARWSNTPGESTEGSAVDSARGTPSHRMTPQTPQQHRSFASVFAGALGSQRASSSFEGDRGSSPLSPTSSVVVASAGQRSGTSTPAADSSRLNWLMSFAASSSGGGALLTRSSQVLGAQAPPAAAVESQQSGGGGVLSHWKRRGLLAEVHESITVLFMDVVGFTDTCHLVSADAVMKMLDSLYCKLDDLCLASGNKVYKVETIGDCYMCATGLLTPDPDHAVTALNFALAMRDAAAHVQLPTTGQPLKVRIGMHSGRATSGIVGKLRRRYCLFGDTINSASRMESTGAANCIHVSDATYLLARRGPFAFRCRGQVEVKGKGKMTTWWVDARDAAWVGPRPEPQDVLRAASAGGAAPGSDSRTSTVLLTPVSSIRDRTPASEDSKDATGAAAASTTGVGSRRSREEAALSQPQGLDRTHTPDRWEMARQLTAMSIDASSPLTADASALPTADTADQR